MQSIKIIRFENEEGKGVFKHGNSVIHNNHTAQKVYHRHAKFDFPTPYNDKLEGQSKPPKYHSYEYLELSKDFKDWFCAYKTVEQFQEWIYKDEIEYFVSQGFSVYMLEVTEYQIGENQILFTKESVIKSENITSLFL